MLTIRAHQLESFREIARQSFENETIAHLHDFARRQCEVMGDDDLRAVVRDGMRRAAEHGFDERGPVRFYIELMFMFGSDFDTDPLLPWARPLLTDLSDPWQIPRAERLFAALRAYLAEVAGPGNVKARAALERMHADRARAAPPRDAVFADRLAEWLTGLYPEKCRLAGDAALRALIECAEREAADHGIDSADGVVLVAKLMFLLGQGCPRDLQFRWIGETLDDPGVSDGAARIEQLRRKSDAWIDSALRHLSAA